MAALKRLIERVRLNNSPSRQGSDLHEREAPEVAGLNCSTMGAGALTELEKSQQLPIWAEVKIRLIATIGDCRDGD